MCVCIARSIDRANGQAAAPEGGNESVKLKYMGGKAGEAKEKKSEKKGIKTWDEWRVAMASRKEKDVPGI